MGVQSDGDPPIFQYPSITGRAYRNQAMALIGICRFFSRFSARGQEQHTEFKTVLRTCDDVLRFAVYSGEKTTHKTNKWFESAIQTLSTYASMFHPGIDLVRARMGVAKRRDVVLLYDDLDPADLMAVNFVLLKNLPDPEPVVVQLMLSPTAGIEEVLWHFAHFEDNRRITLHDNPRFYSELPTSSDAYTSQFKAHPIENLMLRPNTTLYVLVDQPRRVFLETRRETRIFSNVFMLKDVMIFKDVHGVLEGESVVAESILDVPNLWRNEKFFVIPDSHTLAYDLRLHPIITSNPTAKRTSRDRRDLLRGTLSSTSSNDLYVYAGQLPPLWTPRKKDRQDLLPSAPISERSEWCDLLYTTFDALNGNILLSIFNFCRLDDEETWNLKLRWCELSHVCQKWRNVIHRSSSHLDMHIPFTNGRPSLSMLSHLPPLRIDIDYRSVDAAESAAGVLYAIRQRTRIRRIVLQAPSQTLKKLIATMDKHFPQLEYLSLSSTTRTTEATKLMIPRTFLAPKLRHLELPTIYLLTELPLLTFTYTLVTLKLADIKAPGYFTPVELVTQLQHIPQLEDVSIGFSTPIPRPSTEGGLLLPPTAPIKLPALRGLDFRGLSTYLESLLPRISAPHLERFDVTLFNQLTFTLPHLSHFAGTAEGLRHPNAKIHFNREAVSFVLETDERSKESTFGLRISCMQFDWKIHSATQVCRALEPVLSFAKELTLDVEDQTLPSDWQNDIDGMAWHDLLVPFSSVKKLCIGPPFASGLFTAMQSNDAKLVQGILPELQELEIVHGDTEFTTFVDARRLSNRPVRLSICRALPEKVPLLSTPTSMRPRYDLLRITADTLNSNILLTIFDYCRLNDEESWNMKLKWCKLSHVCRKWRHVIHQSFLHLSIHIPFTNGMPPLDVMSHLPPLPIVTDYRTRDAGATNAGVLHAIQPRRDCMCCIDSRATWPSRDKMITSIDEPFQKLDYLSLSPAAKPKEATKLMIPGIFPAPQLRHRKSRGTCLLKGLPLLASSVPLIALKLTDIRAPGYFTPEDLVAQLQRMPQLEELTVGFSIPLPRPRAEEKLLPPPTTPSTALPSLKRLEFRGVGAYLESLIAHINVPLLERLDTTLFNQLSFSFQHLSHLIQTTEALKHPFAKLAFNSEEGVSFVLGPGPRAKLGDGDGDGTFNFRVICTQLEWQTNAATHICAALEPVLSVAEEVTLEFDSLPSSNWQQQQNLVDGNAWRDLLKPFNGTKQLHIICPHAPELSSALESYRAELKPKPKRRELELKLPALRRQYLEVPIVEFGLKNPSPISTDTSTASSYLAVPSQQSTTADYSSEVIGNEDDHHSPPPVPVPDKDPDPIPAKAKKNWFRKNVVDRVWKPLGSRVRAGRSSVVRLVSSPFK